MIKDLSINLQYMAGAERIATAFISCTYIVFIALFALLALVRMPEVGQPTPNGKQFAFICIVIAFSGSEYF